MTEHGHYTYIIKKERMNCYGMFGKFTVVYIRRSGDGIELVPGRLSVVYFDRRDPGGTAVL